MFFQLHKLSWHWTSWAPEKLTKSGDCVAQWMSFSLLTQRPRVQSRHSKEFSKGFFRSEILDVVELIDSSTLLWDRLGSKNNMLNSWSNPTSTIKWQANTAKKCKLSKSNYMTSALRVLNLSKKQSFSWHKIGKIKRAKIPTCLLAYTYTGSKAVLVTSHLKWYFVTSVQCYTSFFVEIPTVENSYMNFRGLHKT